jgi:hypothetical protein
MNVSKKTSGKAIMRKGGEEIEHRRACSLSIAKN